MNFDSLIFDMDGTLWDAVDSYAAVWNQTIAQLSIDRKPVTRDELVVLMGKPDDVIFETIIGRNMGMDFKTYMRQLIEEEAKVMPVMGGKLYPGVADVMPQLAKRYKLFMVSNCSAKGIDNFLTFTALRPYITDSLTYGQTFKPKCENIKALRERYNLKTPLYVGDTQGDCDSSHKAGVPFLFASYGFGTAKDAEYSISKFEDLLKL
jgi:phosphoglycolate phosphatase